MSSWGMGGGDLRRAEWHPMSVTNASGFQQVGKQYTRLISWP
jgi:hypothetical protein